MISIQELTWKDLWQARNMVSDNFSAEEGSTSVFHFILSKLPIKNVAFHELKYFTAKQGERILGITGIYSYKYHPENTAWLGWTAVRPESRGQGVGGALIGYVIDYLQKKKFFHLALETTSHSDQEGAIRLYKKLGFVEVGRIARYYNNHDFILMSKELRN